MQFMYLNVPVRKLLQNECTVMSQPRYNDLYFNVYGKCLNFIYIYICIIF